MNEKQKGGKRENAGRKPTDDPKIPVTVYVETSIVEKNGGKIELARRIVDAIKTDFVENPITTRIAENNKHENKKKILAERNKVSVKNFNQPQEKTDFTIDTTKDELEKQFEELLKQNKDGK